MIASGPISGSLGVVLVRCRESAEAHIAASLPHVIGDYMGEHWLVTFALLALTA